MSINVSGSYIDISRLVKAGIDYKKGDLVEKIVRNMKKSKYDESGKTWYFTLENEEIKEMDEIITQCTTTGFSELALNFLRARCKEEAKTDDK